MPDTLPYSVAVSLPTERGRKQYEKDVKQWHRRAAKEQGDLHLVRRFPLAPGSFTPELDWIVAQAYDLPLCEICQIHHSPSEE